MGYSKAYLGKVTVWEKSKNNFARTLNKAKFIVDKHGIEEFEDFVCLALIQALEMSLESLWKLIRIALQEQHGVEVVSSPKGIFHQALKLSLISAEEFDALCAIIDSRNQMAHRYDKEHASIIMQKIFDHFSVMQAIGDRFK